MKNILLVLLVTCFTGFLSADEQKIGTYEKLGKFVPLDIEFYNERGEKKTLGEHMSGKPTVISLNYFNCPGICGPQIDGLLKSLDKIELVEGREYKALTISFIPEDTPELALKSKKNHLHLIRKDFDQNAWSFLTSNNRDDLKKLTDTIGFEYKKIINKQGYVDYIHPAGLVVLSPEGKITRYLSGIKYLHFDLKMALLEASEGKVRPTIAKALAFCFSFDPENSKYVFATKKCWQQSYYLSSLGCFYF